MASIALNSKPLLPSILDLTNLVPYFGKASPETLFFINSFATRLYNFTGSPLCDQATSVLWGLRSLSELVATFKEGRDIPETASASDIQFSDRVEVLERLVHRLWFIENSTNPQHVLFQTFGWTCLIHIYTKFRELPLELGMNKMLARKVKVVLETCGELNVLLATFPDLFLWEMFICGRAASDRDKPFLTQQATKILMVRKLEDAKDILAASDKFIWPERGTEAPFVAVGSAHVSREVIEITDD